MKYALIIGNNKYDDPKLAQLKTPAADSQALAKVLDDKKIGGFDVVIPLINQYETKARRAISEFLADKKPDDLVLLYFSGHGILDDRGRLYLALKDTQFNLLKATSISSSFIADEMDSCRSRRQILILDCCHSGAFARGAKGEQKAITETTFEGSGFGRVVLTASDSTQYALEGDQVLKLTEFSLFTHFLLDGLQTGQADINNDGQISLDEWYDYTYGRVISETPRQVPHKWSYNQQGDLVIARNPFLQKKAAELPYELVQALDSSFVGIRESAVNELGKYLHSHDPAMVELAVSALERMEQDDSRRIASLAQKWLTDYEQARAPGVDAPASSTTAVVGTVVRSEPGSMPVEAPPSLEKQTPKADPGQGNRTPDRSGPFQKIGFSPSFWFKWIGTAALAIVAFIAIYFYYENTGASYASVPIFAGLMTTLTSLAQWFFFRPRLDLWWVPVNAVTGIVLSLFLENMFENEGWEPAVQGRIVFAGWLLINLVLGLVLQETEPRASSFSSMTGTRTKLFLALLPAYLVLAGIANIILLTGNFNSLQIFGALYSISALLVCLSILLRGTPLNFGFITLALFLLFEGINAMRYVLDSSYSSSYALLNAIPSMAAGLYFIFQQESRRNIGFLLLAGYLLANGVVSLTSTDAAVNPLLLVISTLFCITAAIFLFLRK